MSASINNFNQPMTNTAAGDELFHQCLRENALFSRASQLLSSHLELLIDFLFHISPSLHLDCNILCYDVQ